MHDRPSYLIPASLALLAHSALFFGFPSPHPISMATSPTDTSIFVDSAPFVDPPPQSDDSPSDDVREIRGALGDPMPDITDLIDVARHASFVVPVESRPIAPAPVAHVEVIRPGSPMGDDSGTGGLHGGPIDAGLLDSPPVARVQIQSEYPSSARSEGMTGEVTVEFVVAKDGHVARAEIIHTSNSMFDETTLRAVKRWRFEPGRIHGQPTAFRMRVPIEFNLSGT